MMEWPWRRQTGARARRCPSPSSRPSSRPSASASASSAARTKFQRGDARGARFGRLRRAHPARGVGGGGRGRALRGREQGAGVSFCFVDLVPTVVPVRSDLQSAGGPRPLSSSRALHTKWEHGRAGEQEIIAKGQLSTRHKIAPAVHCLDRQCGARSYCSSWLGGQLGSRTRRRWRRARAYEAGAQDSAVRALGGPRASGPAILRRLRLRRRLGLHRQSGTARHVRAKRGVRVSALAFRASTAVARQNIWYTSNKYWFIGDNGCDSGTCGYITATRTETSRPYPIRGLSMTGVGLKTRQSRSSATRPRVAS